MRSTGRTFLFQTAREAVSSQEKPTFDMLLQKGDYGDAVGWKTKPVIKTTDTRRKKSLLLPHDHPARSLERVEVRAPGTPAGPGIS